MDKNARHSSAISRWPEEDRPREKLLRQGEHTLSDSELLAILLRTGTRGESAVDLARKILGKFKTFRGMGQTDSRAWREFKGLGPAKICQVRAAVEIGRRFGEEKRKGRKVKVTSSRDAARLLMSRMRDLKKEVFKVILLDGQNRLIDIVEVEEGTVGQASPIIREIISRALQDFASAIICVHNHPSGNSSPSQEDREFTRELASAGRIMQTKILDHIIIGDNGYFSFADSGLMADRSS